MSKPKHKEPKVERNDVAILKDGKDSPFWQTLKHIIEAERAEINASILQIGLDESRLSDVKDLIKWHDFLGYVLSLPERCIESLESKPVKDGTDVPQYENDPYPLSEVRAKIVK